MTARRSISRRLFLVLLLALVLVAPASPARADHHLMVVQEVFALGDAQYVELRMTSGGQNLVANSRIRVFNASNVEVAGSPIVIPGNVAVGNSGSRVLFATADAQTLFGVSADHLMSPIATFPYAGGRVCFEGRPGEFGLIDCVAWGTYSGPAGSGGGAVGKPAVPVTGILRGSSIGRTGADTDSSANDFRYVDPSPRNNAGEDGSASGGLIRFFEDYEVAEDDIPIAIAIQKTVDAPADVEQRYSHGTASPSEDFTTEDGTESIPGGGSHTFTIDIHEDSEPEPNETIFLALENPDSSAVLGTSPVVRILILDDDDEEAPATRIGTPKHRATIKSAKLKALKGTASDNAAVAQVEVALRQRLKGGGCKWWNGSRFKKKSCSSPLYLSARSQQGSQVAWSYKLRKRLPPSVGAGKVANYTAYARATDQQGNVGVLKKRRNLNTFEVT